MKSKTIAVYIGGIVVILLAGVYLTTQFVSKNPAHDIKVDQASSVLSVCGLTITHPVPMQKVSKTFMLEGSLATDTSLPCRWTLFEGQAGIIEFRDDNGSPVGEPLPFGPLEDTWMEQALLGKPVAFAFPVTLPETSSGFVTMFITEEDPSGMLEVLHTVMLVLEV